MIVEFIGLPGAGKSTLHAEALAMIRGMGIPVCTPSSLLSKGSIGGEPQAGGYGRFWNYLAASWCNPGSLCLASRCLGLSRRSVRDKWFGLRLFWVALGLRHMVGKSADPRWILFDEGLMQRAFTVFVDRSGMVDARAVRQYVNLVPLPHVLVYLKVDLKEALDRLVVRKRGLADRFANIAAEHAMIIMDNSQRMFQEMLEEVGGLNRGVVIVEIDANDLNRARKDLEKKLGHLLQPAFREVT